MAKDKLTNKQREILEFIRSYTRKYGYPPCVREIGKGVGLSSPASVYHQLNNLEEKGFIRRDRTKPRTIEIVSDEFALFKKEISNVPMVGQVAAGEPILAEQNITDYFPLPADILPNEQVFMLKIKGDSMVNAGILDGDNVIVRQKNVAKNGDMVVAMIEDGATVKYYYKESGHFRLQPDNPDYEPIIVDKLTILGEVIGVIRMF